MLYIPQPPFRGAGTVLKDTGSPNQLREWAGMDNASLSVTSSHFRKSFEVMQKREQKAALLPPGIRERFAGLTKKMLRE